MGKEVGSTSIQVYKNRERKAGPSVPWLIIDAREWGGGGGVSDSTDRNKLIAVGGRGEEEGR